MTVAQRHGSRLLLKVVNLLDQHEQELDKTNERIEAKLDLMLHWLGLQLFEDKPAPAPLPLRLAANRIEWAAPAVPEAGDIVLNLHIHPAMAAPLSLPGRVASPEAGRVAADLHLDDEALLDAWTQWLFRRHRRAVHEARRLAGQE
ncbi:MAG: PilZ domain-containing protein [Hydrogenophilaceae bacterium]